MRRRIKYKQLFRKVRFTVNILKKTAALLALILVLTACGGGTISGPDGPTVKVPESGPAADAGTQEDVTPPEDGPGPADDLTVPVRAAALKGPTAMGMVRMMADDGINSYTLAGAADEVTPLLIKGELDMACVPANLAAVLYNQTEGEIVTLAVNTLGVLYIVENGEAVQSVADLAGKTIAAAGKGSTPEFGLRYLLEQNGLDPDKDVAVDWKSEHAECVSALAAGNVTVALLPQPFVTVAQGKLENLRIALDLTAEWDALDNGSAMITGVIIARRAFIEEHPEAVDAFLEDYAESVAWVNANTTEAAALIGELGIVDAAVAEKALPYCNIVCITGKELEEKLSGYLGVLFDALPQSVGGALPEHDFYYGA